MKDLSKTFVSLPEWLPGEVVWFFFSPLKAMLSCLQIPQLLFSPCLCPPPAAVPISLSSVVEVIRKRECPDHGVVLGAPLEASAQEDGF